MPRRSRDPGIRRKKGQRFVLVILDDDRKVFSVHELVDDRAHNDAVVKQQEAGRNVRCQSVNTRTREETITAIESQFGYRLVDFALTT